MAPAWAGPGLFLEFLMSPKGSPLIFLVSCDKLDFQKPKWSLLFYYFKNLALLSLRYNTDFGRSRLVGIYKYKNIKSQRALCFSVLTR